MIPFSKDVIVKISTIENNGGGGGINNFPWERESPKRKQALAIGEMLGKTLCNLIQILINIDSCETKVSSMVLKENWWMISKYLESDMVIV